MKIIHAYYNQQQQYYAQPQGPYVYQQSQHAQPQGPYVQQPLLDNNAKTTSNLNIITDSKTDKFNRGFKILFIICILCWSLLTGISALFIKWSNTQSFFGVNLLEKLTNFIFANSVENKNNNFTFQKIAVISYIILTIITLILFLVAYPKAFIMIIYFLNTILDHKNNKNNNKSQNIINIEQALIVNK